MGSWSVSCAISKIAITSGHDCVIIPLKHVNGGGYGYWNWQIATLPIFGQYDDYGGLNNIIRDDNVEHIENHFGVTIDEFITFLVDGKFYQGRDEATVVEEKIKNLHECEEWKFCWIDRHVYEHMIKNHDNWETGQFDVGQPELLKLFGFEQVENQTSNPTYDPKRYKHVWQRDGVLAYSDGNSLIIRKDDKDQYVWHYGRGDQHSIETYVSVPEGNEYLKKLNKVEAWRLMDPSKFRENYGELMGNRYEYMYDEFDDLYEKIKERYLEKGEPLPERFQEKPSKVHITYFRNLDQFGDRIAHLFNLSHNMYAMSSELLPYVLYLTPQCGEFEKHQIFLEEFARINKMYCKEQE